MVWRSGWCNNGPTDRCGRCPGEGPTKTGTVTCVCACHTMPVGTTTANEQLDVG